MSDSFRDSIPTVDQTGKRVWMYPRKPPVGKRASPDAPSYYTLRSWLSWFLLLVMVSGPFIKINGNPLLMMNVVERKFSIFGMMFWPQDFFLFALAMITLFVLIVLSTAAYGRIWCGWLCPQTVMMEMVFRKIEYWIEGDANQQKALNAKTWDQEKLSKKAIKHSLFFLVSFGVANLLLGYVIGGDALIDLVSSPPTEHAQGFFILLMFTGLFYLIFARFREQACTFVCPYGRFQSVLLDPNSIVVAYDHKRGEQRSRKLPGESWEERLGIGKGDCVDCGLCVSVCPTGIDIRNGTQMECVNCCNCIDACNSVMHKVGRPSGLIRYASQNQIEHGEKKLRFTPRLKAYSLLCAALSVLLFSLLLLRPRVDADLRRMRGSSFQIDEQGQVRNTFEARFLNKTGKDMRATFELISPAEGELIYADQSLNLPAQDEQQSMVVVLLPHGQIQGRETPIKLALKSDGNTLEEIKSVFLAPAVLPEPVTPAPAPLAAVEMNATLRPEKQLMPDGQQMWIADLTLNSNTDRSSELSIALEGEGSLLPSPLTLKLEAGASWESSVVITLPATATRIELSLNDQETLLQRLRLELTP